MRYLSSTVLSLTAMALSTVTTYLTFFDTRYTLSAAVSSVSLGLQQGGFSDGERVSVSFRRYLSPSVILSNRGTRPLVVTDVRLFRSAGLETCEDGGEPLRSGLEPLIVEPGSVQPLRLEFALPPIDQEVPDGGAFDLEDETALWCLRWTVFDPAGQRREPVMPAATATIAYAPPAEDEAYPSASVETDHPKGPATLVRRGFY